MIEEDDTLRLQPCFSPVWDTALTLNALADAGVPGDAPGASTRRRAGCSSKEVRRPGDWSLRNPGLEPGGWLFEYRNGFYPDIDDTAMVLMALAQRPALAGDARRRGPGGRARRATGCWRMQNRDGGWAAFDRDINNEVLTKVPFADHNAMLDPSCPDITARVLEALGQYGYRRRPPAGRPGPRLPRADAGAARLLVRPLGRQLHLRHLAGAAGPAKRSASTCSTPMVRRAVAWLEAVQQPCGGWGETLPQLRRPVAGRARATPTASQTAWAVLGLIAAGRGRQRRGPRAASTTCSRRSSADGTWDEDAVHRHRLPEGLLPEVSPLPALLPAHGPGPLPAAATGTRPSRPAAELAWPDRDAACPTSQSRLATVASRRREPRPPHSTGDLRMRFPLSLTTTHRRLHRQEEDRAGRSASRWC